MEKKFAKSAYRNFLGWGVCSALAITVCTIVDAALVGNLIGSDGLAVANLATPAFLVYALLGLTVGVGANVLIGREMGANRVEQANRIFSAQLLFGLLLGVGCLGVGALFGETLCRFLGATDALLPLAKQYLTVVFFSAPIFVLYHILSISVRTDGEPKLAAIASAVVIVTNLSLDLLFMKGLGWGIVGASASLCIAEGLGMLILLSHFGKKHALLRLRVTMPTGADVRGFIQNGFGVGSAFAFQGIVMVTFNTLLLRSGDEMGVLHVAIFGIIYTMSMIPFAVFDGAGNALSTVVSIFVGERDTVGILTVLRQGMQIVSGAGLGIAVLFLLGAPGIVRAFGLVDPMIQQTAVAAFRLSALSILFTGLNSLMTAFWQAIGRARLAGVMSVMRNFVLMLVLGVFLIANGRIVGLSLTYLCSELLALVGMLVVSRVRGSKAYIEETYPSTGRIYETYYPIKAGSIAQVSADLEGLCEDWEIPPKKAFFINLIVEELILNIIKFGLRETDKAHYIAIKLLEDQGEYIIRIRDNVSTYNPFDSGGDEIDHAAIKMIMTKTTRCDYQRKLIFNYLYLIL